MTNKELREMARARSLGQTDDMTTAEIDQYLQYRRELGWPHNRSISGRLVSPKRG